MLICAECRESYPEGTSVCPKDGGALLPEEAFADADVEFAPGTMMGEYRIERRLGTGSFGAVYAGEQPLIGKKVAIKVLHRKMSADPEMVSRFIAEARAVNRIRHRNIIDIFSFGLHAGRQHYFVMELLDGLTLSELIAREGRIRVADALPILRGIAEGLGAAHGAEITHRDLKPDNVLLARDGDGRWFPKLLDFGVAKLVDEEAAHKTATGVAVGTPRYMAPEQSRGKKIDHRVDIYALGVVTHEMLTGRPPFEADSVVDLLFKHVSEPPPAMSSVCPDLPPELDAPVLAMLAKRPKDRPGSAVEAIKVLADAARANGVDAPREAPAPADPAEVKAPAPANAASSSSAKAALSTVAAAPPAFETAATDIAPVARTEMMPAPPVMDADTRAKPAEAKPVLVPPVGPVTVKRSDRPVLVVAGAAVLVVSVAIALGTLGDKKGPAPVTSAAAKAPEVPPESSVTPPPEPTIALPATAPAPSASTTAAATTITTAAASAPSSRPTSKPRYNKALERPSELDALPK